MKKFKKQIRTAAAGIAQINGIRQPNPDAAAEGGGEEKSFFHKKKKK